MGPARPTDVAPWLRHAPPWPPAAPQVEANPSGVPNSIEMSEAEAALAGKLSLTTGRMLRSLGWERTIRSLREASHVTPEIRGIPHKAARLAHYLRVRGAPVRTSTPPCFGPKSTRRSTGAHVSRHRASAILWRRKLRTSVAKATGWLSRMLTSMISPASAFPPGSRSAAGSTPAADCGLYFLPGQPGDSPPGAEGSNAIREGIPTSAPLHHQS